MRYEVTEDNGERLFNFVDRLKLDISRVGCRFSGLVVERSRLTLIGAGLESRETGWWMRTAQESHNRTKRPSTASSFSMLVDLQLTDHFN